MRRTIPTRLLRLIIVTSVLLSAAGVISAQTGGSIDLSWHVQSSSGTSYTAAGNLVLGGTLGQFGAGQSASGSAALVGGFWSPDGGAPLAVDLGAFDAVRLPGGVRLRWETVSELNHAGFNIYRGPDRAGPWARLNDAMIVSPAPGTSAGHAYEWLDAGAPAGPAWYLLEAVAADGSALPFDPVSVEPVQQRDIWLPLIGR